MEDGEQQPLLTSTRNSRSEVSGLFQHLVTACDNCLQTNSSLNSVESFDTHIEAKELDAGLSTSADKLQDDGQHKHTQREGQLA